MPAKSGSRRKTTHHENEDIRKLSVKSAEIISIQTLMPQPGFSADIIQLAQDLAYHHVTSTGLSSAGSTCLTMSKPCLVLPPEKFGKNKMTVVGGLESFFIGRTVSLDCTIWCHVLQRAPKTEQLLPMERKRLLTIAPLYCQSGHDGAALLKRIWKFCTPAERKEMYGVSSFKAFAARANVKTARQIKAPFASTRANYKPGDQMQFPDF